MLKTFVVTRGTDRERLLDALRELGVVHLTPVDPASAVADEKTLAAIGQLDRAVQILSGVEPTGDKPDLPAGAAAAETLEMEQKSIEWKSRLAAMHRQIEQLKVWGDVRLEQFEQLRRTGIDIRFYSVPSGSIGEVEGDCVEVIRELPGKRSLVAAVTRGKEPEVPEGAAAVELPPRDRPSLRQEAAGIDRDLADAAARQARLARLLPAMRKERAALAERAQYTVALRGGLADEHLFAVQGWVPHQKADSLAARVAEMQIHAAVQTVAPTEEEQPPTLIEYPRWARPIKGLFDILGTVAGYREFDVTVPFMIALPIFAAILIGDGGYGAVLLLGPLLLFRQASRAMGKEFTKLLAVIGGVSLIWGLCNASFFGVVLYKPLIPVNMSDASRNLVMRISFLLAAVHLSVAQGWRGVSLWPSLRSLAAMGWAAFIWGMLGVVKYFVLNDPLGWDTPWAFLLLGGAALAILFDSPSKNPLKMIGLGVANFPLSMVSAFSDVISYVRLMAVGLASSVLAGSFNELALSTGSWVTAIPILLLGHGLNLGLCLIALFAHGVRLNMLEFSNNLGMQWTGYSYEPFAKSIPEEIQT